MRTLSVIAAELPPAPEMGLTEDRWLVLVGVLCLILLSIGVLTGRNL